MSDVTTLKPGELMYLYDAASYGLAHAKEDREEKMERWLPLHGELARRLDLQWHEETSGQ